MNKMRAAFFSWTLQAAFTLSMLFFARVAPAALEPVPEEAFSAPEAAGEAQQPPDSGTQPSAGDFAASPPKLGDSLNPQDHPTPIFQQWLDRIFDLFAPGDPYARDKLKLVLGTSVGYDNNVLYSATNRIASSTYGVNGAIDYHFGSRRLQIDAKLNGGINYYQNRPGGTDDQNYGLALNLAYQWMPRLGIAFNTYTAYLSQPSPQFVGGTFAFQGSYFYTDTQVNLNYQMRPRLSLVLGYEINGFKYDDESMNESSGFYSQNYSLSANWLLSPRTTFVLEYRFNPVTYYEAGLGSTGQFFLLGVKQSLTPRLNYTLLFGAEYRELENPSPDSPPSYLGPFAEGTLVYNFAPRSTLNATMRLGTEPAGTSGVTIRQTFRSALNASHQLGSRVSLDAGISFEYDKYDQPGAAADYTQSLYTASIAFRYQFAIATSVVLQDSYSVLTGSLPDTSYTRNFVSLGLEVTF